MRALLRIGAVGAGVGAIALIAAARAGPASTRAGELAVRDGVRWVTWWRGDAPPVRWGGTAPLADRISWRAGAEGVEWGDLRLRGPSEAWRTRIVVARLDPRRVALTLVTAFDEDARWDIGDAPPDATVALDAGQFRGRLPWGWVVAGGRELLKPQFAPLAGAVVIDSAGAVTVVPPGGVAAERARGRAREAFQSYPMLLQDGVVPAQLYTAGLGVEVDHRDARLALGTLGDGRVVVALTRFDALGETLGRVPLGLTSAEMAAVMGALGCRQALLLDGGASGQLMLRDGDGSARTWPAVRRVPLGLIGHARP